VKYAWIDGERKAYPLPAMCETLAVSISGYRAWRRGGSPKRKRLTDAQLLALIQAIHRELKGAYGCPGWYASCGRGDVLRASRGWSG
jgi:putative transposase